MIRFMLLLAALAAAPSTFAWEPSGAVFTMSNDPAANAVLSFAREADGSLRQVGSTPTGGRGSGGGLGSQGALAFSRNGRFLLAVDAGSNEVTAFRVRGATLQKTGSGPSGGQRPVSLDEHGGIVYVVNAGSNDVSGLRLDERGRLHPIPGSTRALAGAGPAQIAFDPTGDTLVVSEKATNSFSLFQVGEDGLASGPTAVASEGQTPFGFAFTRRGTLVVSEAFGGRAGESALSSYFLEGGGLVTATASLASGESAVCWVELSRDGRHAYTTNTASHTLSHYSVDRCGRLHLVDPVAAATEPGGGPIDLDSSRDGRFVYVLNGNTDAIEAYQVAEGGSLLGLGVRASGLPPASVGLLAR